MRLRSVLFSLFLAILSIGVITVGAQATCDATVEDALDLLGDHCAGLDRNTACYGYTAVTADFTETQITETFTEPADRVSVMQLAGLQTAAYNPDRAEWGIAVMNVQANLPATLPGQGVTVMVLGGMEIMPDATAQDAGPMQAFTFTAGVGMSACQQAPAALAIRSPGNTQVELTLNGTEVRLGSTVVLTDNGDGTTTAVMTDGTMEIVTDGTQITEDEALDFVMDAVTEQIVSWSPPRPATDDERETAAIVDEAVDEVVPEDVVYVVEPGDNLYRIALENGTCVSELARVNGIPEDQVRTIRVGQTLTIPDGATCGRFVSDVTPVPGQPDDDTNDTNEAITADCTGFRLTSPLEGLPLGAVTLYWDGVSGAEVYSVTITRGATSIHNATVNAPTTNYTTDLSNIASTGDTYTWTVIALANNETICRATSPVMLREFPRTPPPTQTQEVVPSEDNGQNDDVDDNNEDDVVGIPSEDVVCNLDELTYEASTSCYELDKDYVIDSLNCTFECVEYTP